MAAKRTVAPPPADNGSASLLPLPAKDPTKPGQPAPPPAAQPAPAASGSITTADQLKQAILSGANTNAAAIANAKRLMDSLKASMQAGTMTVSQYQQIMEPNMGFINQMIGGGLSGGQQSANEAKAAGAQDIIDNYLRYDPTSSKLVMKLPFTNSEYAQLPNSALPTQEEAQKGLFDPKLAPMDRFQTGSGGAQANPGGGTNVPGVGPDGATNGGIPSGGIVGGPTDAGADERKLLDEANYAKQLRENTVGSNKTQQDQYMSEIAALLQKQQDATFKQGLPGWEEQLNTQGLLRSSALGDRMAKEAGILAGQTSTQLGQMGLTQDLQNLNQNTANTGSYIADRGSAIGRRFSLEDYARQLDAATRLGSTTAPQIGNTTGGKGSGALSGAATGAVAGAPAGPWGAGVGAVTGAVAGGQLGSK